MAGPSSGVGVTPPNKISDAIFETVSEDILTEADLLKKAGPPMFSCHPEYRVGGGLYASETLVSPSEIRSKLRSEDPEKLKKEGYFNLDQEYDEVNGKMKANLQNKDWYLKIMKKEMAKEKSSGGVDGGTPSMVLVPVPGGQGIKFYTGKEYITFRFPRVSFPKTSASDLQKMLKGAGSSSTPGTVLVGPTEESLGEACATGIQPPEPKSKHGDSSTTDSIQAEPRKKLQCKTDTTGIRRLGPKFKKQMDRKFIRKEKMGRASGTRPMFSGLRVTVGPTKRVVNTETKSLKGTVGEDNRRTLPPNHKSPLLHVLPPQRPYFSYPRIPKKKLCEPEALNTSATATTTSTPTNFSIPLEVGSSSEKSEINSNAQKTIEPNVLESSAPEDVTDSRNPQAEPEEKRNEEFQESEDDDDDDRFDIFADGSADDLLPDDGRALAKTNLVRFRKF